MRTSGRRLSPADRARRAPRPLALLSALVCLALVGVGLSTPAAAVAQAEPRWSTSAWAEAGTGADQRRSALETAAGREASGPYRSYAGTTSSQACYGTERSSATDGTPLDARLYGARYGCVTEGAWLFAVTTHADLAPSDVRSMTFSADTDGRASTGCGGYEREVFGFWSPERQALLAGVFSTPDCSTVHLQVLADLQVPTSRDLGLHFTHASLGGGSTVRWYGGLRAYGDTATEYLPTSGDHIEADFGGSAPTPVPTGADGCPTSGNAWYAATSDPDAVGDLRDAGLDDVRRLRGGLVAFSGDRSDAQEALGDVPVQQDLVRRLHALPSDPGLGAQWALDAVRAPQAWDLGTGSRDVVVAVVDSGVDATHDDLQGQLLPGYDAARNAPLSAGNSDPIGHGTASAGVVAAATDNGSGLASLGWNTRVLPIKVADAAGTIRVSAIATAVRYATDAGAAVINMSLGACRPSDTELSAVQYAQRKGVLVVASAGNEALKGNPVEYPAAYPGVLAVGATSRDGSRASYSNTGAYVDLVAPGGSGGRGADNDILMLRASGGTFSAAGTSFSAPLVSAAAALVKAARPGLSGVALGDVLTSTARDTGSPGRDDAHGAGTLDAAAALQAVLPAAPTSTPTTTPDTAPITTPTTTPTTAAPSAAPTLDAPPTVAAHAAAPQLRLARSTTLPGQSVRVDALTTPGATVDLYAYSRPSTSYRRIRSAIADGTGRATFSVAPQTNSRLFAAATSSSGREVQGASSPLTVGARLSTPTATRTSRLTYRFSGTVSPARAGVLVTLHSRAADGKLTRLADARTGSSGRWTVDRRFTRATTVVVVGRTTADASNGAGDSAPARATLR